MAEKQQILQVVKIGGYHVGAIAKRGELIDGNGGEMGRRAFKRFHRRGFETFTDRSVDAATRRRLQDEATGEGDHVMMITIDDS